MNTLLIITEQDSVLSQLLKNAFDCCDLITPEQILATDLDRYDAFAVLGGTQQKGITLLTPMRKALDKQIFKGKKCFAEFVHGIGQTSFLETKSTRFARPVLINRHEISGTLEPGVIFDEQCNDRLFVYKATNRTTPILQYVTYPKGFYSVPDVTKIQNDLSSYALWQEGDNLLVCAFRMCNFSKAKFAPRPAWAQLVSGIVNWLGGKTDEAAVMAEFDKVYTLSGQQTIEQAAMRALQWYEKADILVHVGGEPYAVREGLASEVLADGTHNHAETLRLDCAGESAVAFLLKYLYTHADEDKRIADGLMRLPLDLLITDDCPQQGAVHGSTTGWWNVSYGEDAVRGLIIPLFYRALLIGDTTHMPEAKMALEYLIQTTCKNGLRRHRVDFYDKYVDEITCIGDFVFKEVQAGNGEKREKWNWGISEGPMTKEAYRNTPSVTPWSNEQYMAALCLCYKLTGEERYLAAAERGMEIHMKFIESHPNNGRCGTETQADSSHLMTFAMLYWASGKEEHKEWIYRVTKDLLRFRHPNGGYVEWDTGLTALGASVDDGECTLLSENGNPIMDILYSVNWLPISFMVSYFATGDPWFKELWEDVCQFLARVQIRSDNPLIDGAWPRAFDADLNEIYGIPNDIGWAPWSVESGWTMGPICTGMLMGLMADEIKAKFDALK